METKPKKEKKSYGYKLCGMPESSIALLRAVGGRDHLSYGELVNESIRLYLERYPVARIHVREDLADNLLKNLAKEGK